MIFYFSATGNTQWIAQRIASSTQDHLVSIVEASNAPTHYELKEGERLASSFPFTDGAYPHSFAILSNILTSTAKGISRMLSAPVEMTSDLLLIILCPSMSIVPIHYECPIPMSAFPLWMLIPKNYRF